MRDFLIILGSSIVLPPNHHNNNHFSKLKPSTTTKLSPSKPPPPLQSPSTSSPPTRPPLFSTVRWDSAPSRRRNHLKYYADLASNLAEDARFHDFLMITESVVVSGIESADFLSLLSIELFSAGIVRVISEGKVWRVVEVLICVEKLGIDVLRLFDGAAMEAIAEECRRIVKRGEVEEAVKLMEILAGLHFSIKELVDPSEIVGLCVRKRDSNIAIRYACIIPHAHILFCTIIHEFGKKGDLVSALTVFEASKQKSIGPNMYAYRTIIDVCGLCGDYLKSRSIYEELLAKKVTPNIYVFNSLMNVNACDLSYTLQLYKHMKNLGVAADMTSYNILLKSCCIAARVDLAQNIYSEVQRLESSGVLKLDVFTYSTIIKIFADAKLWQMSLKIKDDMLSAGVAPNTVTWSSLISACANAGLVEQAIQLFDEMLLTGCQPNSQCCNVLLHACVEAFQYDRAFRLFRSWKESGFHKASVEGYNVNKYSNAGAYGNFSNTMLNRTAKSHNLNFPRRVLFTPTTATYNILMKACGTDYYRAKALMDEMNAVGLSPNYISWSTLVHICGGSGNVEGAVQILSSLREAGIQPDVIAYTAVIKVCVERKDLKTAFSLFAEMKRYQIKPNMVTYNTLLRARSTYGSLQEVQQCLEIYQDMRKAGYKSNDYYLKQLIEEWCEGVIQNNNQYEGRFSSCNEADLGGPHSLLLEKVAVHLQKRNTESMAIDLQGLTKVEARIVVLAVLRMIKENNAQGCPLKDDLFIILQVKKTSTNSAKAKSEVEDAITKLLQDELGLEVTLAGSEKVNPSTSLVSYANEEEILGSNRFPTKLKPSARRPAILHRLKVTRKSLRYWLQRRKIGACGFFSWYDPPTCP
ncbi:pentatricopeptide repeat-containing protein At5g02830, chloroplastic isoform X1 [Camellia sinensis]|uniref:pentatricopeptide repeat-containing protein At5g02830, chloroplastic isoform X1 n=1 Tax=Camellia sinensis TaxID=4442 RepID=UPI0010359434|nr:pentatricopeptide repeat-containing protein At5g02830, chloroplastic isoform X1 [Camellia sinensis]